MTMLAKIICGAVHLASKCPVPEWADRPLSKAALGCIHVYRRYGSRKIGRTCLFHPTCSCRAVTFLEADGFRIGMGKASSQIRRCGGAYSAIRTANGETWLISFDGQRFGPEELNRTLF
jgi:putative component of membrane protein insertase Oxa1/YidC/SpoIIIJ protein YidD